MKVLKTALPRQEKKVDGAIRTNFKTNLRKSNFFAIYSTPRLGAEGPGPQLADQPDGGGGQRLGLSAATPDARARSRQPVQQREGIFSSNLDKYEAATGRRTARRTVLAKHHSTADKLLGTPSGGYCDILEGTQITKTVNIFRVCHSEHVTRLIKRIFMCYMSVFNCNFGNTQVIITEIPTN